MTPIRNSKKRWCMLSAIQSLRNGCASRAVLTTPSDRNFVKLSPQVISLRRLSANARFHFVEAGRKFAIFLRWGRPGLLQVAAAIVILAGITALSLNFSQRGRHPLVQGQEIVVKRPPVQGQEIVVKGEVLDMTCYIAHNLSGPQHAECAKTCIRKGLPVGIKGEDGKTYLLVGEKQAVNAELADYAAKTVTIRGKETMRDGFALLQVEEIRKF
jgi:hypothetical protein